MLVKSPGSLSYHIPSLHCCSPTFLVIVVVDFKICRYQNARNSFAQATNIDPAFAEAWYNKGVALMNLEKYLEAIRVFDKAIAINPDDRHRHDSSGIWHRRRSWSPVVPHQRLRGNKRNYSSK